MAAKTRKGTTSQRAIRHHRVRTAIEAVHQHHCEVARIYVLLFEQRVALTGRIRTGPPYSVGRLTAHAPDPAAADRRRARFARRQRYKRRQTTYDRRHRAKQHWPIRRASNNNLLTLCLNFDSPMSVTGCDRRGVYVLMYCCFCCCVAYLVAHCACVDYAST